ncbi:MAG: hypothetical protein ACTSSH_07805 [Candidatus Heimdallarchaeota archaeon]
MLISLATINFRLSHLLREKLIKSGFTVEHILINDTPSKGSILVVTTEKELKTVTRAYPKLIALSNAEVLSVTKAFGKIMLGIEGKRIWESLIIGVDPGLTIGVALIADGCLRSTLETRVISEVIQFILGALRSNPAKMAIVRVGSTGGYRRILLLNELLNVKLVDVTLEVVDEMQTTPSTYQEAQERLLECTPDGLTIEAGKDATAAMEIAFRIGESVKSPENWAVSDGELKEIQVLSHQYSKGKVTITKDLAKKVAAGRLTLEQAITEQKLQAYIYI